MGKKRTWLHNINIWMYIILTDNKACFASCWHYKLKLDVNCMIDYYIFIRDYSIIPVKCYISPSILPWIRAINCWTWRHHSLIHRYSLQMAALVPNKLLPILKIPLQQRWYAIVELLRVWQDWSSGLRNCYWRSPKKSGEANSCPSGQEFLQILWNLKPYYHV